MSYQSVRQAKERMGEVITKLSEEFGNIQTGRPSTTLFEKIEVSSYGTMVALQTLASISLPEPNQIAITPWNSDQLNAIENAVRESDLNVSPINDGKAVRINFPPMTQERRQELTKQLNKIAEEARIALRDIRHTALEQTRKEEKSGDATEDDVFQVTKQLDDLVEDHNAKVVELVKVKEQEILTV
ncbi:ribosome recycling factor [Candidatus Berkelbacteria bacterium]|nr:ribosome recycling factor [Candidatus Berkelbacteria bacterium]